MKEKKRERRVISREIPRALPLLDLFSIIIKSNFDIFLFWYICETVTYQGTSKISER